MPQVRKQLQDICLELQGLGAASKDLAGSIHDDVDEQESLNDHPVLLSDASSWSNSASLRRRNDTLTLLTRVSSNSM